MVFSVCFSCLKTGRFKSSMAEAPVGEDAPKEEERATPLTHDPLPEVGVALWERVLKASVTAGAFLLLYTLSQLTVSLCTFLK